MLIISRNNIKKYCLDRLHLCRPEIKLISHEIVSKDHHFCDVIVSDEKKIKT